MKKNILILLSTALITLSSCQNNPNQNKEVDITTTDVAKKDNSESIKVEYAKQSVDDQTAKNISNYLIHDYLKDELKAMNKSDRKFQFFKVDLNSDGKEEIFVRLMSPYFCGTGGCTLYF